MWDDKCKDCIYFHMYKKLRKGKWEYSSCCTYFVENPEDGYNDWVLEADEDDLCEMFKKRNDSFNKQGDIKMNIKYKDSDVLFNKHNAYWKMNPTKCPCCNKEVQNGDAILVINNYKYFGNVLLHIECFEGYKDKEALCELLEHKYAKYKILDDVFGSRTR